MGYADADLPVQDRENGPLLRRYTREDAARWGEDYDTEMAAAAADTTTRSTTED